MVAALVGAQPTPEVTPTLIPLASSVIREDIFVRAGPGQQYLPIGQLLAGDTVAPVARNTQADWVLIIYRKTYGWIRRDLASWVENIDGLPIISETNLTPSPTIFLTKAPTATIIFFPTETPTGNFVVLQNDIQSGYVRAGPGRTYLRLAQLYPGDVVEPVGRNADTTWILIRLGQGFGWIRYDLVKWVDDLENLPVLSPDNLTPTATFTPSNTPIPTLTPSNTPTVTATYTPTITATMTPSFTATALPSATTIPSPTEPPTAAPTATPTATSSSTSTTAPTATRTLAPTATGTKSPTATATILPTNTPPEVPTATETAAALALVASDTPIPVTSTAAASATITATQTPLPSETPSATPLPPTSTVTVSVPAVTQAPASLVPSATNIVLLSSTPPTQVAQAATPTAISGVIGSGVATQPSASPPQTAAPQSGGGIPSEALLGGVIVVLVVLYIGLYYRGVMAVNRYTGGFVVERCPVCQRGHLIVDTRQERLLGLPRPRRIVRCDVCRSVLRETSPRRWRYAIDPIENPDLYRVYNGQELDEQSLIDLANQPSPARTDRIPHSPASPPDFVDDDQ